VWGAGAARDTGVAGTGGVIMGWCGGTVVRGVRVVSVGAGVVNQVPVGSVALETPTARDGRQGSEVCPEFRT